MSKLYLGISFFLSVVLLGGCGGGDGSSGSAGADGAAGTIALPTNAGTLALNAEAAATAPFNTADADNTIGQVAKTITLSGTDNLSADSRTRYFVYLGKSATTKDAIGATGTSSANSVGPAALPIDTRLKASGADNVTLTLTAGQNLGDADGSITHLIVCPGNEAGDATTCATLALNDRGTTSAPNVSTSGHGTVGQALVATTGSVITLVTQMDNGSIYSQTMTPGTKTMVETSASLPALSGTVSSLYPTEADQDANAAAASQIGTLEVVGTSNDVYIFAAVAGDVDNISMTTVSTGATVWLDNMTGSNASAGTEAWKVDASADSSGNLYFSVMQDDNRTIFFYTYANGDVGYLTTDNLTVVRRGVNAEETNSWGNYCSVAHPDGGAIYASVGHDNGTHAFYKATDSGVVQAGTGASGATLGTAFDNETGHVCDMAFDSDGKGYFIGAYDNRTGLRTVSSSDDFSTLTLLGSNSGGTRIGDPGGNLNDVKVVIHPTTKMPIVAVSSGTVAELWMFDNVTDAWQQIGADVTVDINERIGLAYDDPNIIMTTTDADNATITVHWNE